MLYKYYILYECVFTFIHGIYMYHIFFTDSSVAGHLGNFPSSFLDMYPGVRLLNHMVTLCLAS